MYADVPNLPEKSVRLQANIIVDIHPPRAPVYNTPAHDRFHDAATAETSLVLDESLQQRFREAQVLIESTTPRSPAPGDDVQVIPLGTGSALPMKYRNGESCCGILFWKRAS
jgi:ribonuclease Z